MYPDRRKVREKFVAPGKMWNLPVFVSSILLSTLHFTLFSTSFASGVDTELYRDVVHRVFSARSTGLFLLVFRRIFNLGFSCASCCMEDGHEQEMKRPRRVSSTSWTVAATESEAREAVNSRFECC